MRGDGNWIAGVKVGGKKEWRRRGEEGRGRRMVRWRMMVVLVVEDKARRGIF